MIRTPKITPEFLFRHSVKEIDDIIIGYQNPQQELFSRYLSKKEVEQEAFVLALIGQVLHQNKRWGR